MGTHSETVKEEASQDTVRALEGAKDIGAAALGVSVQVMADTASQAVKAAEGLAGDLTHASKSLAVGIIQGFHEVSAAIGKAILASARGTVQGVGQVGADVGAVAQGAAHGIVKGASDVGLDVGAVTKRTAFGLIHGTAEVSAEFGKVWKARALEAIKGATETALSAEEAVMATARIVIRDVGKLRFERGPSREVEKPAPPEESPPPTTNNILSIAPVVATTVESKPSELT